MPEIVDVSEFLRRPGVILDARSPGEFLQGHIPGAVSFPLFSNEERAAVGTCYKQQGREQAIELGFEIAGPKFVNFVRAAKELAPDRQVRLHCWRGGLRSSSMAWVLETAGLQVTILEGGYKAFRRWVLDTFPQPRNILVLGGMTGTGKTNILLELAALGEQVLDLEQLASHRGSSYGSLGLPPQPTSEHFENEIAVQWATFDPQKPIWIEAESRRIGLCRVPEAIFQQMLRSPVLQILRPRPERIALLVEMYGNADRHDLIAATARIRKRLGGVRTQQAIEFLEQDQLAAAFDLILDYYDKTYQYDLERRSTTIYNVDAQGCSASESAQLVLAAAHQLTEQSSDLSTTAAIA